LVSIFGEFDYIIGVVTTSKVSRRDDK